MRRAIPVLMLVLLLSVSWGGLLAQDDVTARVLQVVDSEPLSGQELGLSQPITLYFDRALDCASLERSVAIKPALDGQFTCDRSMLTFTPTEQYQRATVYTLSLSADLRAMDGAQLIEPYSQSFTTIGFLAVTDTFPTAESTEVASDTTITVIFNRPVVPLLTSADADMLPNPLIIEPEVAGSGEWINTSIFAFTPDARLAAGTDYQVRISGITAVDGSTLASDYSFTFSTQSVDVVSTSPAEADRVLLDEVLEMIFNHPMNRQSVEDAFYLLAEGSSLNGLKTAPVSASGRMGCCSLIPGMRLTWMPGQWHSLVVLRWGLIAPGSSRRSQRQQ